MRYLKNLIILKQSSINLIYIGIKYKCLVNTLTFSPTLHQNTGKEIGNEV